MEAARGDRECQHIAKAGSLSQIGGPTEEPLIDSAGNPNN